MEHVALVATSGSSVALQPGGRLAELIHPRANAVPSTKNCFIMQGRKINSIKSETGEPIWELEYWKIWRVAWSSLFPPAQLRELTHNTSVECVFCPSDQNGWQQLLEGVWSSNA